MLVTCKVILCQLLSCLSSLWDPLNQATALCLLLQSTGCFQTSAILWSNCLKEPSRKDGQKTLVFGMAFWNFCLRGEHSRTAQYCGFPQMSSKDQVHFGKASKPAEILSVLRWESFGQSDQKACPARRCGEVGSCTKQLCGLAVLETIRSLPESAQSLESLTSWLCLWWQG